MERLASSDNIMTGVAIFQAYKTSTLYAGLKRVLHFNDNSHPDAKDGRCHKFRPLLETAPLFNEHHEHTSHVSIDESACLFPADRQQQQPRPQGPTSKEHRCASPAMVMASSKRHQRRVGTHSTGF